MTNAPYLLPNARWGPHRRRRSRRRDDPRRALVDLHRTAHGRVLDEVNAALGSRARIRTRGPRAPTSALPTHANGRFAEEIVAVEVAGARTGTTVAGTRAFGPGRRASLAGCPRHLARGTITAGNASQLSDGAAAVIVMSAARRRARIEPLAEIVARACAPSGSRTFTPSRRSRWKGAARRPASTIADIELLEINEAFASVARAREPYARRR